MSRNPKKIAPARLPLGEEVLRPSFRRERAALKRGVWPIAGCDEAGRGPLAGPVVAAAVILDPKRIPRGLNDSKKLDAQERERALCAHLRRAEVAVAFGSPARIDRDNILQRLALGAGARGRGPARPPASSSSSTAATASTCRAIAPAVIGGDALVSSIAAASIVAKVTRDRLMKQIGAAHPGYGFERHMGYSVPEHFEALRKLGPTIHHRRSFSPVALAYGDIIRRTRPRPKRSCLSDRGTGIS